MNARFGAYEVLHELSKGGMGSVLLARRRGPGTFEQLVAIKTVRADLATMANVRAMFLDEAAILARIHHPGIASVHDFGEQDGSLYMVMEYVAGIPFRDMSELRPPPAVIARAIAEACRGLHAAHELRDLGGTPLQLVHRDISPDNLLLGFDGHVKVIDFGIALVRKNRQAPVTEFGTVKGKPPYMSPEQVANEPMDRRSDIFSLGVVAWEMLAGRQLFEGDSIYHIAIAVQQQPIVPPSRVLGSELPYGLDAAVMNALERDPARRTPTAAEFAEQLEQVIQHGSGETLESWAERTLGKVRDDHRVWLAGVIGGERLPKTIGRASGQVTELAPIAHVATPVQPQMPATTSIGGTAMDDLSIPPRNRVAPIALVLVLVLAIGSVVLWFATREPAHHAVVRDASVVVDARILVASDAAAEPDAAMIVEAPVDAAMKHPHAPRDAAVVAPKPDAVMPPTGTGLITIKYKPGPYANVSIDEGPALPGPIWKHKIGAGKHTIKFLDPKTGEVLDTQRIDVDPDRLVEVKQKE